MPPPPAAPRHPTVHTQFGDERTDDYAWLRNREDPEVLAYLEAENAYADQALAPLQPLEDELYTEIVARVMETDSSAPVRWGPWWYYDRTVEGLSYPIHCRRAADGPVAPEPSDGPGEQVIVDGNQLAADHEFSSIGILAMAPDHAIFALGVDFTGDERHTVSFRTLDGSKAPAETLEDVGYAVAWSLDARTLFYVRVDEAWRPHQVWRHELGSDPSSDVLVYEEADESFGVGVSRSRDDATILLHVSSSMTTEVLWLDAREPGSPAVLLPRRHGIECAVEHLVAPDGSSWWLVLTNDEARDFRLLAAPCADPMLLREVVAERPGTRLDGVEAFDGFIVLSERLEGCASVRIVALLEGPDPFGEDLVARGSVALASGSPATTVVGSTPEYSTPTVRIEHASFTLPHSSFDVVLTTGEPILRKRQMVRGGYDPSQYVSARLWVPARDGVLVPVSLVHHRDLLAAGAAGGEAPREPAPLLLYGYGSYEASIDPYFSSMRLSLLDRGVIYAVAHVRGGGELGRAWYEAGRLEHKQTTFLDFVDVARHLVEHGFTQPSRLAAMGGSAGGLLMGASINLAPSLFRCVVAEVPFVDVLSTILDPSLPLTVGEWEEWGDPLHDPDAYRRVKSWSPYDNVTGAEPDGTPRVYPELLVLGSFNDTRVSYWEPAKWVAKIRAANPENRAILKTDLGAGHAGPSGRYDSWRERAMIYSFLVDRLGASHPAAPETAS
jgi:oligopeptidase B